MAWQPGACRFILGFVVCWLAAISVEKRAVVRVLYFGQ